MALYNRTEMSGKYSQHLLISCAQQSQQQCWPLVCQALYLCIYFTWTLDKKGREDGGRKDRGVMCHGK